MSAERQLRIYEGLDAMLDKLPASQEDEFRNLIARIAGAVKHDAHVTSSTLQRWVEDTEPATAFG